MSARYLTAEDIAEELSCSLSKAYEIAREISGTPRCTREGFEAWLVAHTVIPEGWSTEIETKGELVYFIQSGPGGAIKIGWTRDLRERMCRLQIGNPVRLVLLATMRGGEHEEGLLHGELRAAAVGGEWFAPTPEVLAAVARVRL